MSDKKKANQPVPRMTELGVAGHRRSGTRIYDDFLTALQGSKGRQVYREMADNEAIVSASLNIFDALLQQTPWHVEPVDKDNPQAVEIAEFVGSCLEDMEGGVGAAISRMLTAAVYGFAVLEKVYKIRRGPEHPAPYRSMYRDGKWGIRKLPLRLATTIDEWVYESDTSDEVLAAVQRSDSDAVRRVLPMSKILHYRCRRQTDSPEGRSLLRGGYISYRQLKNARFVESVGIERYMAGLPKIELPLELMTAQAGSAAAAARAEFEAIGARIRRDEQTCIIMPAEADAQGKPTGYKFSLVSGGGDKPADIDPVIRRYESRIAMVLLTEVMLLGSDAMGSYALSKDKSELLVVGLESMLDSMYQVLREQLLTEVVQLNGWPAELTPYIVHGKIKAPNLADLGAFISSASGAGFVLPGPAAEEWTREQIGMPPETTESPAHIEQSLGSDSIDAEPLPARDEAELVEDVSKTAMSGIQVEQLLQIAKDVSAGVVPRESAIGILEIGFQLRRGEAEKILASVVPGSTAPGGDVTQ